MPQGAWRPRAGSRLPHGTRRLRTVSRLPLTPWTANAMVEVTGLREIGVQMNLADAPARIEARLDAECCKALASDPIARAQCAEHAGSRVADVAVAVQEFGDIRPQRLVCPQGFCDASVVSAKDEVVV